MFVFQVQNSCRFGDYISDDDVEDGHDHGRPVLPHLRDEGRHPVLRPVRSELLLPQPVPGQRLPHSQQEQGLRPDQRPQPDSRGG